MHRSLFFTAASLLLCSIPVVAEPIDNLVARPGQWSTVIAVLDHNQNHYLLKTTVNEDPQTCWAKLEDLAKNVKNQNGVIWTNPTKSVVNYETKAGYAEKSAKVLEIRCVLEPFSPEYVKKLGAKPAE